MPTLAAKPLQRPLMPSRRGWLIAREMQETGLSLRQIASELASKGIRTARGGQWTATAVRNVLARDRTASP
jgi:hypothetical protein